MEPFEYQPSSCFEQVFAKDKPSPLRIIKRRRNNSRYVKNSKGSYAAADRDDSPPGSLIRPDDSESLRTLKLPRRRPKIVSEEKHACGSEAATGLGQSSQRSSLGHSSVSRDENDDILGQGNKPRNPSFFRYPTLKIRKIRQKRYNVKNSFEGDGDGNLSTCTLPTERSAWLDLSSRASSRCTNYEPKGANCLTDTSLLSNSSLLEKTALVLSPYIRVVSETGGIFAGQQHLWAAVEVSGRLFPAGDGPEPEPEMMPCSDKGWWSNLYPCVLNLAVECIFSISKL